MKTRTGFVVALFVASFPSNADDATSFPSSIGDFVSVAVSRDNQLEALRSGVDAARSRSDATIHQYLPYVVANATPKYGGVSASYADQVGTRRSIVEKTWSIELRQYLYKPSLSKASDLADRRLNLAQIQFFAAYEDLCLRAVNAYLSLIRTSESLGLSRRALMIRQDLYLASLKQRAIGIAASTEVARSNVARVAAERRYEVDRIEFTRATLAARRLVGDFRPDSINAISRSTAQIEPLLSDSGNENIDFFELTPVKSKSLEDEIDALDYARQAADEGVSAEIVLSRNGYDASGDVSLPSNITSRYSGSSAEVRFSIPLFNRGLGSSRESERLASHRQKQFLTLGALQTAERDVDDAKVILSAAIIGAKASEQYSISTAEAVKSAAARVAIGMATRIDQQEALSTQIQSLHDEVDAKYLVLTTWASLRAASGHLVEGATSILDECFSPTPVNDDFRY